MADLAAHLGELGDLRDRVAAATDEAVRLELVWAQARDAGAPDAGVRRQAVTDARAAQQLLSANLHDTLTGALAGISDDEILAVLDPAVPLVLLPVGIETRFTYAADGTPDELLVRVLPDEIHVQDHEPELADGELRAGTDYWTAFFHAGRDPAREAAEWARLSRSLGPGRAAWVAGKLTPSNLDQRPTQPVEADQPLPVAPQIPPAGAGRASGWTRPAVAGTLPDRWLVLGWQASGDAPIFAVAGAVIPDELQVGPTPYQRADGPLAPGSVVEAALQWLVNFREAEKVGMGVRIKLSDHGVSLDPRPLLRRLAVVGVSASLDARRSAQRLGGLIEDHLHTTGFGFLPIGTPTNNTATDSTPWTARAGADAPAPVALDPSTLHPQASARIGTDALGLDPTLLAGVPNAGGRDQIDAEAIQTLLWSSTGGYLIEHLWRDDPNSARDNFSPATRDFVREHFTRRVRARGPLPTLRVGSQPYGLLPATSMTRWTRHAAESSAADGLTAVLRAALVLWKDAIGRIPSVTRASDPDVLEALGIAPVSTSVRIRAVSGSNRLSVTNRFVFPDDSDPTKPKITNSAQVMVDSLLAAAGFPPARFPPLFAAQDDVRLWLPLAEPYPGSMNDKVGAAAGVLESLMNENAIFEFVLSDDPATLLTVLARNAATLELALAAEEHDALKRFGGRIAESELLLSADAQQSALAEGISLAPSAMTALRIEVSPGVSLGGELASTAAGGVAEIIAAAASSPINEVASQVFAGRPSTARSAGVAASAAYLAARLREQHAGGQDAFGSLERLVAEALDLWSHRLDAWITSLATLRLDTLRTGRPDGVHLGGFGYVEDLSPDGAPAIARTDAEGTLLSPVHSDGSLLAPSLDQATTAAILRSGQLTHRANGALALDLSSARARIATEIVEGTREGQPLGALIGYRIERRMHEAGAKPGQAILNAMIADLRRIAGIPAAGPTPVEQVATEATSAQSVVDGLRLLEPGVDAVIAKVPGLVGSAVEQSVRDVLALAQNDIDAVADLLLAESVFQVTTGRPDRAAATLDALAGRGGLPGDPEVLRTPRRGTAITMRVLIVQPGDASAASWGWPIDGARATAEPRLDAWAGALLGDPRRVRFQTADLNPTESIAAVAEDRWIAGVWPTAPDAPGALDVLALAAASSELMAASVEASSSPLLLTLASPPAGTRRAVRPQPAPLPGGQDITLLEFAALARSAATVLAASREPAPAEFGPDPAVTAPPAWSLTAISELQTRAQGARDRLGNLAGRLSVTPVDAPTIHEALRYGLLSTAGAASLAAGDQATIELTQAAAAQRVARASDLLAPVDPPPGPNALIERATAALQAIFGPSFRAVAVDRPPHTDELIASSAALSGDGSQASRTRDWLERAATARPGAAALADAILGAEALPVVTPRGPGLLAAQAPHDGGAPWLGDSDPPPRAGADPRSVSIAFALHGQLPAQGAALALLVVDEWTEVVPASEQVTGLAFSYDAPGARPPQAILLAVHPQPDARWDVATLAAVIAETADLSKIRMVDLEAVSVIGAVLPALYCAQEVIGKVPKVAIDLVTQQLAATGTLDAIVAHLAEREA